MEATKHPLEELRAARDELEFQLRFSQFANTRHVVIDRYTARALLCLTKAAISKLEEQS